MTYAFEESLTSYLFDLKIRTAVDALLSMKPKKIDVDNWDDVVPFYRAYVGAQAVRADTATALHEIWSEVWKGYPDENWRPLSVLEQTAEWDSPVDLAHLWETLEVVRVFEHRRNATPAFLLLGILLDLDEGVKSGFGIVDENGLPLIDEVFGRPVGKEEVLWSDTDQVPLGPVIDLSALRLSADRTWSSAIEQFHRRFVP